MSAGLKLACRAGLEPATTKLTVSDSTIELTEELDEKLIGGFVLSFDDKQLDASILRQIKNLKKEFDINLYIKGF